MNVFLFSVTSFHFCVYLNRIYFFFSFFYAATIAMICGILSWILTYFIPSNIISKCENMSWGKKVLFAIFPNMALEYGYSAISVYETRRKLFGPKIQSRFEFEFPQNLALTGITLAKAQMEETKTLQC